jgi:hypothetical protein
MLKNKEKLTERNNMSAPQKPQLNIKLEDTTPITCNKCNGEVFVEGVLLKKASKFLTGTAEDALIPIPTFSCSICGHVNEEFLPKTKV